MLHLYAIFRMLRWSPVYRLLALLFMCLSMRASLIDYVLPCCCYAMSDYCCLLGHWVSFVFCALCCGDLFIYYLSLVFSYSVLPTHCLIYFIYIFHSRSPHASSLDNSDKSLFDQRCRIQIRSSLTVTQIFPVITYLMIRHTSPTSSPISMRWF